MARQSSGLSLVLAINKPAGLSSHDVVNISRGIFGERRVGHAGTLDPFATGVLPICVGPATRLSAYLSAHTKRYRATIGFGYETTTDDKEGSPTHTGSISPDLLTGEFAFSYIEGLVGRHKQVPPRYSALKYEGKRAYQLARTGQEVNLKARPIEIFEASLIDRYEEDDMLKWVVDFSVSKGTYIRSLARDIGRELACPAHLEELIRTQSGQICLEDCVSLESLKSLKEHAALDPLRLLDYRAMFADEYADKIATGQCLAADKAELVTLKEPFQDCPCVGDISSSHEALSQNERVCMVVQNRLKALYIYDTQRECLCPDCVFATGVSRG